MSDAHIRGHGPGSNSVMGARSRKSVVLGSAEHECGGDVHGIAKGVGVVPATVVVKTFRMH